MEPTDQSGSPTGTDSPPLKAAQPKTSPKKIVLWAFCIIVVWPTQYLLVVPMVVMWRVFVAVAKFAAGLGCIGIALLFLPVIGWIILLLWLMMRRSDKRYEKLLESISRKEGAQGKSMWTPWLLQRVKEVQ